MLFSCQSKRQLCLPLCTWGSPLGDLNTPRPRGRGSHFVLPLLWESGNSLPLVLLVDGFFPFPGPSLTQLPRAPP